MKSQSLLSPDWSSRLLQPFTVLRRCASLPSGACPQRRSARPLRPHLWQETRPQFRHPYFGPVYPMIDRRKTGVSFRPQPVIPKTIWSSRIDTVSVFPGDRRARAAYESPASAKPVEQLTVPPTAQFVGSMALSHTHLPATPSTATQRRAGLTHRQWGLRSTG